MAESDGTSKGDCNEKKFLCGVVEGFYGRPWTLEQRKDLFAKLNYMGLNTYMYAPKDDFKHRAYWRELYSVEEAEQLTTLVRAATENDITFFYALSPGLDISYSNPQEILTLKRKLDQVSQFGCNAFALLFDDIEPEISEKDKEMYQSFAHAQVAVANEIYEYLSHPEFIFCPTEYCAARALPNVRNSEYLNTIGQQLHANIDVMWTGPKVISKDITIESIQELTDVLHRPPLIWDNLHANDYDQKRLFLGPYCGRSTSLIPGLRGVLSNPNCEYETNFVPIHTLAQWSKCTADGKADYCNETLTADIKLETETDSGLEDYPMDLNSHTYHPLNALKLALKDWMPEFYKTKNALGRIIDAPLVPTPTPLAPPCPPSVITSVFSAAEMATPTPSGRLSPTALDSTFKPLSSVLVNSLIASKDSSPSEPMDCNILPPSPRPSEKVPSDISMRSANYSDVSMRTATTTTSDISMRTATGSDISMLTATSSDISLPSVTISDITLPSGTSSATSILTIGSDISIYTEKSDTKDESAEDMQTETDEVNIHDPDYQSISFSEEERSLLENDLTLLVDLFYLPFEHGRQGIKILKEFHWLKSHGYIMCSRNPRRNPRAREPENPDVLEWLDRASKFENMTQAVAKLLMRLTYCPNRSLLYDLYPYIWDVKGVISMLNSYLKWIALGRVPMPVSSLMSPPFSSLPEGYKGAFMTGEQEPWAYLGGLTAELQHLLPLESVSDLFLYKSPEIPNNKIYTIRPYLPSDEVQVYDVCRQTCNDGLDGSECYQDYPNLVGDKFVGHFLCLSPEYCVVVEDEIGICGYALAALDAKQLRQKCEISWIPDVRTKYPPFDKEPHEVLSPSEEIISSFYHRYNVEAPDIVYQHHSSILRMNILPTVNDTSLPKRMLTFILSTLKANGSHGVFVEVANADTNIADFFSKLGFLQIAHPGFTVENVVYMGRTF